MYVDCTIELTPLGIEACEGEMLRHFRLELREDGTGLLRGQIPPGEIPFMAAFFIGLGREATVIRPPELIAAIKRKLTELLDQYS